MSEIAKDFLLCLSLPIPTAPPLDSSPFLSQFVILIQEASGVGEDTYGTPAIREILGHVYGPKPFSNEIGEQSCLAQNYPPTICTNSLPSPD